MVWNYTPLYLRNILLPVIFVYFCFGLGITSSLGCSFPWISYEFKNCGGGKSLFGGSGNLREEFSEEAG